MKRCPTVSILIPAYNASPYLERCLNSVASQTHTPIETIILDDGSSDDTLDISNSYASKISGLKIESSPHQGVACARRKLIEMARGDYLLFIDADDWIEPNMVEILVKLVQDSQADISMCGMIHRDKPYYPLDLKHDSPDKEYDTAKVLHQLLNRGGLMANLWNKLIRRSLCKDIHHNTTIRAGEDLWILSQLLPRARKVVCTSKLLYHYEITPGSITQISAIRNAEVSYRVWSLIEQEGPQAIIAKKKDVSAVIFHEAVSYAYALLKHNSANSRTIIRDLIPDIRKRLPASKCFTLYRMKQVLWAATGIIGGYGLMRRVYNIYQLFHKDN